MHSAAVAATQDVTLASMSTERAVSLLKWLPHHGDHLTRLELAVQQHELRQLPCPDLLDLSIRFCRVQLSAADDFPGVLQECTKLTRLHLFCEIVDAPGGAVADSLSSLVHLQHLRINVPAATLPCMHHLTHLEGYSLSVESLLQLGGLSSLQELHLSAAGDTAVGPSSVPGLSFPASLKTLVLLSPVEAGILSLVPPGLQHLTVHRDVEGPAEGPGSFLSYMARLKHLTQLFLWPDSMVVFMHLPPAGPAYSALTASSSLVRLEFCPLECPGGIWQYVFASHKLLHLTELKLADTLGWGEGVPYPSWGAADISSLISCCPNLRVAETLSLQPGLHVSELHKLTALTRLSVNIDRPDWFDYEGCVIGLAAVTQLRRLVVGLGSDTVKVAHLLPLTSLTALTLLAVDVNNVDEDEHLWLNTPEGSAPDVWLQLLERCAAEPECQPTAVRSLAQQLAEHRALTAQHEQKLSAQQEYMLALEQRVAMQDQQIAGLHEELSAQQLSEQGPPTTQLQRQVSDQQQRISAQEQLIAVQQQQIAGLQAQLQELHAAVQQLLPPQQH